MAVTITLVHASANWLRYLVSHDGQAGDSATITTTGAASPDLRTDSPQGVIHRASKVFNDGYGQLGPGALTQAQARALFLADWPASGFGPIGQTNENISLVRARASDRTGVAARWAIDADVDIEGHPILTISEVAAVGARDAYVDIEVPEAIGT